MPTTATQPALNIQHKATILKSQQETIKVTKTFFTKNISTSHQPSAPPPSLPPSVPSSILPPSPHPAAVSVASPIPTAVPVASPTPTEDSDEFIHRVVQVTVNDEYNNPIITTTQKQTSSDTQQTISLTTQGKDLLEKLDALVTLEEHQPPSDQLQSTINSDDNHLRQTRPHLSPSSISDCNVASNGNSPAQAEPAHNLPNHSPVIQIENLPEEMHVRKLSSEQQSAYVNFKIGNYECTALLDTGCEYNLVPRHILDKTGLPFKPVKPVKLILASGQHFIQAWWAGTYPLTLGSTTFEEYILVAESGVDILLGLEFLKKHRMDIRFSEDTLVYNEERIPIMYEKAENTRVLAATSARIPAGSGMVIPAKFSSHICRRILCESTENTQKNKLVVLPTQHFPNKPLLMQIYNANNHTLRLKKNRPLAETFEIHPLYLYKLSNLDQLSDPTEVEEAPVQLSHTFKVTTKENGYSPKEENALFTMTKEDLLSLPQYQKLPDKLILTDEEMKIFKENPKAFIPEHLWQCYTSSIKAGLLNFEQKAKFAKLLRLYQDLFSKSELDVGCITGVVHRIDTGDAPPINVPMRRTPKKYEEAEREALKELLAKGIIEPSLSPWSSPPCIVKKRDSEKIRYTLDYRLLNSITKKISFPIPHLDTCIEQLQGNHIFSKMDAASGFYMIPLHPDDKHKTAFQTKYGKFCWNRLSMGLCNSPSAFSACFNEILENLLYKIIIAYIDDLIVPSKSVDQMFLQLLIVFDRMLNRGVKLKPSKSIFFQSNIDVLGRLATGDTLRMSDKDIKVIEQWPVPTKAKEVARFLGLCSYHRAFIKAYADISKPLYNLQKKGVKFLWTDEHQNAFDRLKSLLTSPPILSLPRKDGTYIMDVDASDVAIGCVLNQLQDGKERVISYASASLTATQREYCTTRRELLAVTYFCHYYRHYVIGSPFIVRTDHASLTWLMNFKHGDSGQLTRWFNALSDYDLRIVHRKGSLHANADSLSRILLHPNHVRHDVPLKDLPCKGCTKCEKAYNKMKLFLTEIEEVEPLATARSAKIHNPLPENAPAFMYPAAKKGTPRVSRQPTLETIPEDTCLDDVWVRHTTGDHDAYTRPPPVAAEAPRGSQPRPALLDHDYFNNPTPPSDVMLPDFMLDDPVDDYDFEGFPSEPPRIQLDASILPEELQAEAGDVLPGEFEGFIDATPTLPPAEGDDSLTWPSVNIAQEQKNDADMGPIHHWLSRSITPSIEELKALSPAARYYWLHSNQMSLENDILRISFPTINGNKTILPRSLRPKALQMLHDDPASGHAGRDKTLERVQRRFHWFGMTKDIDLYTKNCLICQRCKSSQRPAKHAMVQTYAGFPFETVHIDYLGPLPKTRRGNQHVLVLVCKFTKFILALATPDQKAKTTSDALMSWFMLFGLPHNIMSDRGKSFENEIVHAICKHFNITKQRTTSYRPASNGAVERNMKVIATALRAYCRDNPHDWDIHLQSAMSAMRSSIHASTGYTPNFLFFGREPTSPVDLQFALPRRDPLQPHEYLAQLRSSITRAHEAVREKLKLRQIANKRSYDIRIIHKHYDPGDAVYILNKTPVEGIPKKLLPVYKGPALVVERLSSFIYRCRLRQKMLIVHHDHLKPCKGDVPKWLQRARNNLDEQMPHPTKGPHCICGGPYKPGTYMIACDLCDCWFHGTCVKITEEMGKSIQSYSCQNCTGDREEFRMSKHERHIKYDEAEAEDIESNDF